MSFGFRLLDWMMIVIQWPIRLRRRGALLLCLAAALALAPLLVGGCSFARVAARNARWYFRTPAPAPRADLPRADDAALSVLWIGHASALIQIHDRYVLTDPVFTELVGGFSRRLVLPGLSPEALPPRTVVLVSHRHFDHLSKDSLAAIDARTEVVLTPEGASADVRAGLAPAVELPWWHSWEQDGLRVTAVPVVHDGARWFADRGSHPRAFSGYVIEYRGTAVYFPGDTAYRREVFTEVARRFPAIALALLPIGPITPVEMMRPNHLDPEQALDALRDLGAHQMVPIHFGTWLHSFDEPGDCERSLDAAVRARPELTGRVFRLAQGERRVLLPSVSPVAISHDP